MLVRAAAAAAAAAAARRPRRASSIARAPRPNNEDDAPRGDADRGILLSADGRAAPRVVWRALLRLADRG
jgi:hypothetical protein